MSASVVGINPELSFKPTLHPEVSAEIHPESTINAKARDLSFKFSDRIEVNCCFGCLPKRWEDRDIVYINHHGEIEPFLRLRKKVLRPRREHEKSYRRMRDYIVETLKARGENVPVSFGNIERDCGVDFHHSIEYGRPLQLSTVRKINRALRDHDIHSPHSPNYRAT